MFGFFFQAQDDDEPNTNNSHVVYTIIESLNHTKFSLNGTSGQLYLDSLIDYENEDVMKVNGVVTVVILAEDLGSPALSTNISVKITVQVNGITSI